MEPSFVHAWAQTDRYALALGFINNNFDFFHPETYTLDLQFPAVNELKVKEGITRVDFPIHEYLIALTMKMTGSTSPFIFRVYILLYSWIGLVFLALLVQKMSGSRMRGLFVMVFAFTAPVFAYYQAGFLPTIPSIADAMIAFYFYYIYKTEGRHKSLYISLLFFTLSALSRTPFSVLLIAFTCQQLLEWIRHKRIDKKELVAFACSYAIIISYFLYNAHLGKIYGSIFLSHPLPAENWMELKSIVTYSWQRWRFDYFTKYHYLVLFCLFCLMIVTSYKRKWQSKFILVFVGIAFVGELLYSLLMVRQFVDHDYYFLDTFYFIVILLLTILISRITLNRYFNYVLILFLIISLGTFTYKTNKIQKERYSFYEGEVTRMNFNGSEFFLDSLGISHDAKILVLGAFSYNIPFVKMNRKGYAVLITNEDNIKKGLEENFDYIVIQDQYLLTNVISSYPQIISRIEKVAGNGKISVYKSKERAYETMENFLELKPEDRVVEYRYDFDNNMDTSRWSKVQHSTEVIYEGKYSGKMISGNEFGLTFIDSIGNLKGKERLFVSFETLAKNLPVNDVMLVFSIENPFGISFYKAIPLSYFSKYPNWKRQLFEQSLPTTISKSDILKIYLWNSGRKEFYYDDFKISIYKPS